MDFDELRVKNLRTEDTYQYTRLHLWVNRQLGKATHCSIDATHQSKRFHWANISGEYHWDLADFRQLCASCNLRGDYQQKTRELKRLQALGNTSHNTPVVGIDEEGTAYHYDSLTDASTALGILLTSISNCLKGRSRSAGRLKWVYQEVCFGL